MGALRFALHPPQLAADRPTLRDAYITGIDRVPWRTRVELGDGQLVCARQVGESGSLNVPWDVPGFGQIVIRTTTLMERAEPYHLQIELARGKLNQLRNHAAEWELLGLQIPNSIRDELRSAQAALAAAFNLPRDATAAEAAERSLSLACWTAERLTQVYADQVFKLRHTQYPKLGSLLGCRIGAHDLSVRQSPAFYEAFNSATVAFNWKDVEPSEGEYNWTPFDELIDWCHAHKLVITGGPLINWTAHTIPDWLWLWEEDFATILSFMSDFIQAVINRYQNRIRIWEVTARTNCGDALAMSEEERLRLTVRALRVARQTDPEASFFVTLSQPWAEYMARAEYEYSPLHFGDALLRADLGLTALGLEVVHGYERVASWNRDLLDLSALLDQYAVLGVPLRVALAAPSARKPDPKARTDIEHRPGESHGPWTEDRQADWAEQVVQITACKPYVQELTWSHFSDGEPHEFPNAGLIAEDGKPKPSLARLRAFRQAHLR